MPREERVCKYCDLSAVEDEFHFVFQCVKYENARSNCHNIIKDYFQINTTSDSKKKLLCNVMSSKDPVITDLLAKHISNCFNIRDKSP